MIKLTLSQYLYSNKHRLSLGLFVLILFIEVGLTVAIPNWRGYFYGLIEAKQVALVANGCWLFVGLIGSLVLIQSLKGWLKAKIGLGLRSVVTDILLLKWNKSNELVRNKLSFPDQRINEDAKLCTVLSLGIVSECLISGLIVIYLVISMENLLLLAAAFAYIVIFIALSMLFKKPLVGADIDLQVAEADQRFTLSKMVLSPDEAQDLTSKFKVITHTYTRYIRLLLGYNLFNGLQNGLSVLVPFLILLPMYFTGDINFGILMRDVAAFELIVLNATILLNLYSQLITMFASWHRVKTFYEV